MCTLTYFQKASGELIITSNRDESRLRKTATLPQILTVGDSNILAPVDPEGGGSWFAVTTKAKAGCLLNGAFGRHLPQPPYRKSRGLILLDALTFDNAAHFAEQYDLEAIEPFTLVLITFANDPVIEEIKWDGKDIHIKHIEKGQPQLWSSPMMYPAEVHQQSLEHFREFLKNNPEPEIEDLYNFNLSEAYDAKMELHKLEKFPILGTISISSIFISKKVINYIYRDFKSNAESSTNLYKTGT